MSGVVGVLQHERENRGGGGVGDARDELDVKVVEKERVSVRLLAPTLLRNMLERTLVAKGEAEMTRERLRKEEKETYWNLVYWSARFKLNVPIAQGEAEVGEAGEEGGWVKELVVLGLNEVVVERRTEGEIRRRVGGADGEGGDVNAEDFFAGANDGEIEGLKSLKNVLCTGSVDGIIEDVAVVADKPPLAKEESRRSSWAGINIRPSSTQRRKTMGFSGDGGPGGGSKLPTPGKRIHDAICLFCQLRSGGKFRQPGNFPPLSNVYRVLLLMCGEYDPPGIGVEEGEFDKLYVKGISR